MITRTYKPFSGLAALLLFVAATAFGQATPSKPSQKPQKEVASYSLGDQMIAPSLGLFVPLFFQGSNGIGKTNLTVGAVGSLMWSSFLNNNWALGFEVGGQIFASSPNDRKLYMAYVAPRLSYFIHGYPFDFPIFLDAGVNFSWLSTSFKIDPILKPGVGILWNYSSTWSFGANLSYWWIPQIYTGASQVPTSDTRFGNFLDISITALYHF